MQIFLQLKNEKGKKIDCLTNIILLK